jgi:hypothetical protein
MNDKSGDLLKQNEQRRQQNIIAAGNEVKNKLADLREETIKRFPELADILKDLKVEDKGDSAGGGMAATDGKDIEVNAERLLAMGDQASKIIAHELWHIKRNDTSKMTEENKTAVNIATDAVINRQVGLKNGYMVDIDGEEQYIYDVVRSSLEDPKIDKGDFDAAIFGNREKWHEMCDRYEEKKMQKEKGEEQQEDGQEQESGGREDDGQEYDEDGKDARENPQRPQWKPRLPESEMGM